MASHVFKRGNANLEMNLTPMIDCTFQLIMFFILCSQSASSAIAMLKLPKPFESQAVAEKAVKLGANKVIVNVVAEEEMELSSDILGRAKEYVIDGQKYMPTDPDGLTKELQRRVKESADPKGFYIEVRADKKVRYADIATVFLSAGLAGIEKVNLTALTNL